MKTLLGSMLALTVLSTGALAFPASMNGLPAQDDAPALTENVKGGHGHGRRHYKRNRGRHLGWSIGRGNPHRMFR